MRLRKIFLLLIVAIAVFFSVRSYFYNDLYRLKYEKYIIDSSEKYGIDPYLVMAIINTESKFNKDAVSSQGAEGLMQLTKSTAEWIAESTGDTNFNYDDLYDPEKNIKMGVWYLDNLKDEFGSTDLAVAAYNAGQGNVRQWLNDSNISSDGQTLNNIPYAETDNYLKKVLADEKMYRLLYKK